MPSSLRYSQVRLTLKSFVTFPDTVKSHGTTHRLEPYRHLVGKQSEDPRDASKKTETSTLREFFGIYHPLILASCFKTPGFETTEGQRLRQFMPEKSSNRTFESPTFTSNFGQGIREMPREGHLGCSKEGPFLFFPCGLVCIRFLHSDRDRNQRKRRHAAKRR